MPVVVLTDVVKPAFEARYGVPAVNVVNDLTMEAVLAGAVQARSPVIVQTSVKTVRSIGSGSSTRGIAAKSCRSGCMGGSGHPASGHSLSISRS